MATIDAMIVRMGKKGSKVKQAKKDDKANAICDHLGIESPGAAAAKAAAQAAQNEAAERAAAERAAAQLAAVERAAAERAAAEHAAAVAAGGAAAAGANPKPPKPGAAKPTKWEKHVDSAGDSYYYDRSSGVSSWDPPPDAQPPKPPKPTAPKQRSVDVVDMTPHGGSSSSSSPPDFITRGAAMGGGGTIQHFHAGAFAAGLNTRDSTSADGADDGATHTRIGGNGWRPRADGRLAPSGGVEGRKSPGTPLDNPRPAPRLDRAPVRVGGACDCGAGAERERSESGARAERACAWVTIGSTPLDAPKERFRPIPPTCGCACAACRVLL